MSFPGFVNKGWTGYFVENGEKSHISRCRTKSEQSKESIAETNCIEKIYERSFVRGIFGCLQQKVKVHSRDFRIALFLCVPVEKHIDITDAMLSWCDEWRHFYDENNKKEEAQKLHARIRNVFKLVLDFSLVNLHIFQKCVGEHSFVARFEAILKLVPKIRHILNPIYSILLSIESAV